MEIEIITFWAFMLRENLKKKISLYIINIIKFTKILKPCKINKNNQNMQTKIV